MGKFVKVTEEKYFCDMEELGKHINMGERHIYRLIQKEGGPKKTKHGYCVGDWVKFLIDRENDKRNRD